MVIEWIIKTGDNMNRIVDFFGIHTHLYIDLSTSGAEWCWCYFENVSEHADENDLDYC